MPKINENIRDRRLRLGLTLQAVATACGMSRQAISLMELGKRNISVERLCAIAAALRTTPQALMRQ